MQKCRVKDAINPVDTFIGGGCLQVVGNERMGGGAASFLFQQI